tara:strand:+ start:1459 stop:1737 length:279 start_codon:yes stop_codon:yes gene_type:complete
MNKRELIISDKLLLPNTKEDIILKSPFRIPPKGIQDLISLKGITTPDIAYYDISPTENQAVHRLDLVNETFYNISGYSETGGNVKMGKFIDT